MKQIYFLLTILCFSAIPGANAQNDTNQRETSVIFFGKEPGQAKKEYHAHAFKAGLFDIASGMYGVHYEKELSMLFSIQAGAGLTGRNFMQGLLETDNPSGDESTYFTTGDEADYLYDFKTRTSQIGYFIAIHPKFYYDEDGMDGKYFGLVFQDRKYYFEAQGIDPSGTSIEYSAAAPTLDEDETQTIFAVSWGNQTLNKKTALDFHTAIGVRNISGMRRDAGYIYDSVSGAGQPEAVLSKISKSQFYIEFYLRVGVWWK